MKKLTAIIAMVLLAIVDIAHAGSTPSNKKITLSLREAVLLAVRENPNVVSSQLSYVSQKFNLYVQKWQFYPHYSFQATYNQIRSAQSGSTIQNTHNFNIQPAISVATPIGTQISLTSTNNKNDSYNPGLSLQIKQPLMKGFGRPVVEAALNNAKDSTKISELNIEGTLRSTVTAVVNAYLDVVTAQRTIVIDQDALKRAEKSVEQTKLYIKAGHKAGNELVTVQANVASAQAQLENDKNNLWQAKYALLTAIGMDPDSNIEFKDLDVDGLLKKYHLPAKNKVQNLVLENDIQYQTDQITLHGPTSRNLLVAKDNQRWQLDVTANATTGNGGGDGQNSGIDSLFNGANQDQSIGLALTIPINDQTLEQSLVNAKIALQQAELALLQEKWAKKTSAINGWNQVVSAKRSLKFADDAEKLQEKTYHIAYQKYLHGLIDVLELQSAQLQLIQSQQTLLSARIQYLKALVNMDLLTGHTLKTWDVKVRL